MYQEPQSHRLIALSYRDFRLLWFGVFISNIGSQMQIVAVNWHIYLLTNSAFALGFIGLVRFIPIILFSLIGGNVADIYNRKKVLLVTELGMGILAFILALLTFADKTTPLLIYVITFFMNLFFAFEMPSRQSLIPRLVKKEHLPNAISLNVVTFQMAMVIGPAIAGILIAGFGVGITYFVNAFSFLAVVIGLILMETSGVIEGEQQNLSWKAILEGLHFVKNQTMIWSTMILDFFSTFFASATTLLPIFARDILKVGPQGLGFLYAAEPAGAIVVGFIITLLPKIKKQGILLLAAVGIYGIATIMFGLSKQYLISIFALMLIGAGDSISTIIRSIIRQLATPDYLRGRMTSVNMIFFMGGPRLGEFEAGFVAALIGAPLSVITGGLGTLVVVGIMTILVPSLKKYEAS